MKKKEELKIKEENKSEADEIEEKIVEEVIIEPEEKEKESLTEAPIPEEGEEEKAEHLKKQKKEPVKTQLWNPKTELGKKVKNGEIKDIKEIFDNGWVILDPKTVEMLVPNLESDLLLIGQSKGKFGGGQRRVFKQTQKKTMEGNKPKFSAYAVVGNHDGLFGWGLGKAKETVPAREKAFRNAKLNMAIIRRGCGSWQCNCRQPHTIPFAVEGKCGSVTVKLMPAPKGKGLVAEKECQKILKLAGIKDIWSKSSGCTKTKANLVMACVDALKKLMKTKILHKHKELLGIVDGPSEQVEYTTVEDNS